MKRILKTNYMVAQEINSNYFNWLDNDKEIIKKSAEYENSDSVGYSAKSKYHYLYLLYQRYYFSFLNKYQHSWSDYKFIFNIKDLKERARVIIEHLGMLIECYSYIDYLGNKKHSNSKSNHHHKYIPVKMAGILHDADRSRSGRGIVAPHIHIALKLGKQTTPQQLARWSGIAPQYFQSTRGGRWAWSNELAYLIHAKQPNKHLYSHNNVWSNKPIFDYQKYYQNHHVKWRDYRALEVKQSHKATAPWLVSQVQSGKLTKQDILLNPQYRGIYADNMQDINDAVQYHTEVEGALTIKALHQQKYNLSVFYIWGVAGSGKTYLALKLAHKIANKYHWRIYQSAPTNPLDDYSGEEIAILDDVRSTTMGASDWLKLLDPINISPNSARFHNNTVYAKVIIMTNPEPPEKFFGYMRNVHGDEPLSQFIRRLTMIAHVVCTNGHHLGIVSNIRKLNKPYPIKIGTYRDVKHDGVYTRAITRDSRYVSNPNQRSVNNNYYLVQDDVIERLISVVDANNDTSRKHPHKDKQMISLEDYLHPSKYPDLNIRSEVAHQFRQEDIARAKKFEREKQKDEARARKLKKEKRVQAEKHKREEKKQDRKYLIIKEKYYDLKKKYLKMNPRKAKQAIKNVKNDDLPF